MVEHLNTVIFTVSRLIVNNFMGGKVFQFVVEKVVIIGSMIVFSIEIAEIINYHTLFLIKISMQF